MPTKKDPADTPAIKADPTSTAVVLAYVGEGRSARNAPARHLTSADVARLAYRRSAVATLADGKRPDPRKPDPKVVAQLVAELTRFGIYTADEAAIAKAAAELEAPAPPLTEAELAAQTPAQPADAQEG